MRSLFTVAIASMLAAACGRADAAPDAADQVASEMAAEQVGSEAAAATDQSLPELLVYKTPTCGCCNGWVEHMRRAGFTVDARDVTDLMSIKRDAGVPVAMTSCHTTLVDGYVVEGHVPAEQVKRLLDERPDIAGLAAPGMPMGSPGMEGPNARPYQVMSFDRSGNAEVFAEIDPR